jgi:hypothetical protein
MIEVILGVVILGLFGVIIWDRYEVKKERSKFINALIAKTPDQFRDLELKDKVKPIDPPIQKEPEFTPENEMTDDKFQEMIKREVG